jgi:16S rRNA processing protein RimM
LSDRDRVLVGRVVKPHGLRGEVAVDVLSDVPDRLAAGVPVTVGERRTTIVSSRPHQGRLLLVFDGIPDRTAAEELRGARVLADPVDRDELDVYLADELLGLPVRDERGAPLGQVVAFVELPPAAGYDLLEVERDGESWLLPATDDYVEVDEDDDGRPVALVVTGAPAGLVPDGDA